MKTLSKFIATILIILSIFCLVSCKETEQPNAENSSTPTVDLSNYFTLTGDVNFTVNDKFYNYYTNLYFKQQGLTVDVIGAFNKKESLNALTFYYVDGDFVSVNLKDGVEPTISAFIIGEVSTILKEQGIEYTQVAETLKQIKKELLSLKPSEPLLPMEPVVNFNGENSVDISSNLNGVISVLNEYSPLTLGEGFIKFINNENFNKENYTPITKDSLITAINNAFKSGQTVSQVINKIEIALNADNSTQPITVQEILDLVQQKFSLKTLDLIKKINEELKNGGNSYLLPASLPNESLYSYIVRTYNDTTLDDIIKRLTGKTISLDDIGSTIINEYLFPKNFEDERFLSIGNIIKTLLKLTDSQFANLISTSFNKCVLAGYINFNQNETIKSLGFGVDLSGENSDKEITLTLTSNFILGYEKPINVEFIFPEEYKENLIPLE